jgi:hypothetical protein
MLLNFEKQNVENKFVISQSMPMQRVRERESGIENKVTR